MAKQARFPSAGVQTLQRLSRRPLSRTVALWMAAATCGGMTLMSTAVVAQSSDVPAPNAGIINWAATGNTGGAGGTGETIGGWNFIAQWGWYFGDSSGNPSVLLSTIGGAGGAGTNGGDPTGNGGAGGGAGNITAQISVGGGINSGSTATTAMLLNSAGGAGGTAGEMDSSGGNPGQPGAGGNAGTITFNQSGAVLSGNGWNGSTPGTTAILMQANGGDAAEPLGNDGAQGGGHVTGASGATGGAAGQITYNIDQGEVSSQGSAIVALSQGGAGGDGTGSYSYIGIGQGGAGGAGGMGNTIQMTIGAGSSTPSITAVGAPTAATGAVIPIDADGNTAQAALMAAGIQAQSLGGAGGEGGTGDGTSGKAGAGGAGGNASNVSIALNSANVSTTGFAAAGVLAQSIGGAGGAGNGAGGIFYKKGGNGAQGGEGQNVTVTLGDSSNTVWPSDLISTQGDDSMGVVAQSIGGGGGAGGAVSGGSIVGGISIGGSGQSGGNAGLVTLDNGAMASGSSPAEAGFVVSTSGEHSSGLVAQSIGGGGGTGGTASMVDLGAFTYTVGGNGGSGGAAGTPGTLQTSVVSLGIVNTTGDHAKGIVAQAIGGGGGEGGAAVSLSGSVQLSFDLTVGGSGGSGGTAGDVFASNNGQIFTSGADAWGMLAQSVAGGGGNGGSSTSDALMLAAPGIPSFNINIAIGGNGGNGSSSGNVTADNDGAIMTSGAAAHALIAQSVAGGGGNGGDSSAYTVSVGKGTNFDVTVAVGGSGGAGGTGGNVNVDNSNSALLWTMGDSADGIFAQSVGGGGGSGGTSKETDKFLGGGNSSGGSLSEEVGGTGGSGGQGGAVAVTNEGNIMTMGDSANGIFAQSVGGGGGLGTGGTSKDSAGKISNTVTTSGGAAASANGGTVNVTNSATIVTWGGDAAGIYAQSVGGGGGKAGSTTTAGLPTSDVSVPDYLAHSTALNGHTGDYAGVVSWIGGGWQLSSIQEMDSWAYDYLAYAAANAMTPSTPSGGTVGMTLSLGGGATGSSTQGNGGDVNATNNFSIQTAGPASPGIFAESVGAGGGQNGATTVNQTKLSAGQGNSGTVSITQGGTALNNGNSGTVTASNSNSIVTGCNATVGCNPINGNSVAPGGDASFGIFAQSVGGGGGETIVTAANYASGSGKPISLSLGGSMGTDGNGGNVTVNNVSGSSNAVISTAGNDAVGIVAQSVGGSGGNIVVMQTGATGGTYTGYSQGVTDPLLDATGSQNNVSIGSNQTWNDKYETEDQCTGGDYGYAACGTGGTVAVNTSSGSSIATQGRNAHGVLAQSIGGGGGWIVGLTEASDPFNKPISYGAGGNINLTLAGTISTQGDGAYGVLAQSVGAGGVLGGDLAAATTTAQFSHSQYNNLDYARSGNGGNVTINNTGTITTSGNNAHAIFAQSVGGGGGLYATTGGLLMGTAGGEGNAGTVAISNSGTVQATGTGSSAIYVDTQGHNGNSAVGVSNSGSIIGNSSAPAIMLMGGNGNGDGTVTNSGTITANNGTAVSASATSSSFAVVNNIAGGVINGDVDIGSKGVITNNGTWSTNGTSTVGTVNNNGLLIIGGASSNPIAETIFTGNLNSPGTIQMGVDFYKNWGNYLDVYYALNFASNSLLKITPASLMPNAPVEIMFSNGGTGALPQVVDPGNNFLFNYALAYDSEGGITVQALSTSRFSLTASMAGASGNPLAVASNLDSVWQNVGSGMSQSQAQTYASLASISNGQQYLNALTNLGNEGSQAASVAHVVASDAFVERMNSCPRFEDGAQDTREHDCVWGRVIGNNGDRDASGDSVGYHQSGNVFQLGGQKEVATDWFVGGSVSADNSSLDTRAVSDSVDGHGWTAGAVVKHQMGDWLVSAALEGGSMSYDATRQAQLPGLGGTARSEFDVSHWGLHSRISKQFPMTGWYLKPYVDLHATHIQADGYTEQGAGPLDLKVLPSSSNVFGVSPMIEAGSNFVFNNDMSLQVYGGVGGTFYNQGALGADMQFADSMPGSGTFHISSDLPSDRFKTTAGLDLKASDHWDVRLEYSSEFADHFQSDTGALKVSYKF